jgi:hypothetical protein
MKGGKNSEKVQSEVYIGIEEGRYKWAAKKGRHIFKIYAGYLKWRAEYVW